MIQNGSVVTVHYTGKLTNGEEFDSSIGKEPFVFEVGSNQVIPGFENGLIGKSSGEKVSINIPSNEAYGDVREELLMKVSNEQLPGNVVVGQQLQGRNGNDMVNVSVVEVNEDHVIIDGNHPLAGKDLIFDIEIIEIQ
jgi:FKBP-type peptidyl-prolyl cis-trans isomerase 2